MAGAAMNRALNTNGTCRIAALLFATLCLFSAPAFGQAPGPAPAYQRPLNSDCASQSGGGDVNYFPADLRIDSSNQSTVNIAPGVNVTYYNSYKVVNTNINNYNQTLVLYQCGTTPPSGSAVPQGATLIQIPLTSVAVMDNNAVPFLELLGVLDRVQSVSNYTYAACGQVLLNCGNVSPFLSYRLTAAQLSSQLTPFTDGILVDGNFGSLPIFGFFPNPSSGRNFTNAVWIKYLGLFFNLEAKATQIYNDMAASYNQTASTASNASGATKPVVAFVSYYNSPPTVSYRISVSSDRTQRAANAGASTLSLQNLLAINGTRIAPIGMDYENATVEFTWNRSGFGFPTRQDASAAFKSAIAGAQVLVDETLVQYIQPPPYNPVNPAQYNLSSFYNTFNISANETNLAFIAGNAVYRVDKRARWPVQYPADGLDWDEGAVARPDLVLLDLAQAVQPSAFPSSTRAWLRRLSTNEAIDFITPANCTALSGCTSQLSPICPLVSVCSGGQVVSQQSFGGQHGLTQVASHSQQNFAVQNATSTCQYAACPATVG